MLLAIDTSTDALSLALGNEASSTAIHRILPRQHQQQIFRLVQELCAGRSLGDLNLQAFVYGRGPGSFTGLRIGISALQGLAYSMQLPVIGVSSLESQARTFLRRSERVAPCTILSTIDARIGQLYGAWYRFDGKLLTLAKAAFVTAAETLCVPEDLGAAPVVACGSGCALLDNVAMSSLGIEQSWSDVLPEAQDMLAPAQALFTAGAARPAADAQPDYVQTKISWKTLAEQRRKV